MCSNRVNPVKHKAARTKSDRQAFVTRESDSNLIFKLATKLKIPSAVSLSACFVGTVTARRRETTFQASSIPFGWQHFGRSQCPQSVPGWDATPVRGDDVFFCVEVLFIWFSFFSA